MHWMQSEFSKFVAVIFKVSRHSINIIWPEKKNLLPIKSTIFVRTSHTNRHMKDNLRHVLMRVILKKNGTKKRFDTVVHGTRQLDQRSPMAVFVVMECVYGRWSRAMAKWETPIDITLYMLFLLFWKSKAYQMMLMTNDDSSDLTLNLNTCSSRNN